MAVTFKKLFGNGSLPDEIRGELRAILLQMRQERNASEAAATSVQGLVHQAKELAGPITEARKDFDDLELEIHTVQALVPQIRSLEDRATLLQEKTASLEDERSEAVADLAAASAELAGLRQGMEELRDLVAQVLPLKDQLIEFIGLASPFRVLQDEAEETRSKMDALNERFGRMAETHARHAGIFEETDSRLASLEERTNVVTERCDQVDRRTADLREISGTLEHLATGLPDVRRDLATLEALADHVVQRTAVLEDQREAVDRATAQAEHLSDLLRRLDRQTKRQRENVNAVAELRDEVAAVKDLHGTLLARTDEIATRQRDIDARHDDQRGELEAMRERLVKDVSDAVARFEFERAGMDTLREEVVDLRAFVASLEERRGSLEDMRPALDALEVRSQDLAERTAALTDEIGRVEDHAQQVQKVKREVDRVSRTAEALGKRMEELEAPATEALDVAERRIASMDERLLGIESHLGAVDSATERSQAIARELKSRQAAIETALERLDCASKLHDLADETASELKGRAQELTAALSGAEARVTEVRGIVEELDRRAPDLGAAREQLARFEQRFHDWRTMEEIVERALADVRERYASVEPIKQEIARLYQLSNEAMDTVRAVVGLRAELSGERAKLEDVERQMREVAAAAATVDERRQQIAEAEQRLVRAEATLMDIRQSLESIQGQRAFLDQVIETAGSLRFHTKQAEAVIATLREEVTTGR